MRVLVKNNDWTTKKLPITNNTVRTLKNGVVVPTALAMYRKASKV